MAVYFITGKLGAGKSLAAVGLVRDLLRDHRRVATNLDINVECLGLHPKKRRVSVVRLPDKPHADDLVALGEGNPTMDERKNGGIFLDELATWLNARDWADKGRKAVIDFLLHSRKLGWDVYFICQHMNQVDKQIREALAEFVGYCRRMDRVRIPFLGRVGWLLTAGVWDGRFPQFHILTFRYGSLPTAPVSSTSWYVARDLFKGYNTRQVFSDWPRLPSDPGFAAATLIGSFSYLTPWHLVGRYAKPSLASRAYKAARLQLGLDPWPRRPLPAKAAPVARLAVLPPDVAWRLAKARAERGSVKRYVSA